MENMENMENVVVGPLTFELNEDESGYVLSNCEKDVVTVDIPREVCGLPVLAIGSRAFESCTKLREVKFPESEFEDVVEDRALKEIGENAFYYCTSLLSVELPYHVDFIGHGAFYECHSLKRVSMGSFVHVGPYAFSSCYSLVEITDLINVPEGVFADCDSLTYLPIKDVWEIGESAFARCNSLTKVVIPASVKRIESLAFRSCVALETVRFENPKGWTCTNSYFDKAVPLNLSNPRDNAVMLSRMDFDDGVLWWERKG